MLIDAHNHPNWHGFNAEKILKNMDEQNIDQLWLFSWEAPEDEYSPSYHKVLPPTGVCIPLEDVIQVGRTAPDRFVLGYMPHPKRPDAIDRLKSSRRNSWDSGCQRTKGAESYLTIRMPSDCIASAVKWACRSRSISITPSITDAGITHDQNWWYGGSIEAFERAIIACPETNFIGHAPGFWAHISGDGKFDKEAYPTGPVEPGGKVPEMLRQYDNLYADLSAGSGLTAISRDEAYGRQFLIEFQDCLLFGRDYFDTRLMDYLQHA